MSNAKVTLAAGIALVFAVGAYTLTRSPPRVVRIGEPTKAELAITTVDTVICQAGETLPADATAIRLSLVAAFGSRLRLIASRGAQQLAEGTRGADWTTNTVTVPIKPLPSTVSGVTLCLELGPNSEPIHFVGATTPARDAAIIVSAGSPPAGTPPENRPLKGRIGVEYLASGRGSWWSRILSVARHIGIGHFVSGTWLALLAAALTAGAGVLAVRLALRELP